MAARLHHYIPRCYLKGFAASRSKNGKLLVIDGKTKKAFVTTSRNIAAEKDFNRLDIPGVPPDALESDMSKFESELDRTLERITVSRTFQNTNDRAVVFNFIALFAVRNPRWRETMRGAMEHMSRIIMDLTLANRGRYENEMRKAREAGFVKGTKDVSYEDMKKFVEGQQYRVTVPTTRQIQREVMQQEVVLPYLFKRKWILLRTTPGNGTFITSDHPVCLMWSNPEERGSFYPPGFGLGGTDVFFPLTKDLALVGRFEGEEEQHDLNAGGIAAFNGAQVAHAERQVFAMDHRAAYLLDTQNPPRLIGDLINDTRFTNRVKAG